MQMDPIDSQRDLDEATDARATNSDRELRLCLDWLTDLFSATPKIVSAINTSQAAFEEYRIAQLATVDAALAGTLSPTLRNATYDRLTRQRIQILEAFRIDNKPDSRSYLDSESQG